MNNHKRQKGTRELVRDIFIAHPEWNARQIYDRYLILLGDANNAVTLNAVQKHVEEFKRKYREIQESGLDNPWHLHQTLDMPAEVIAHILEVKKVQPKWWVLPPSLSDPNPEHYVIKDNKKLTAIPRCMTVREARWVSRLYAVKSLKKPEVLVMAVAIYSLLERLAELSGLPLDTSEVDEIIASNKNVKDALKHYFCRISPETWRELIKDVVNV